MASHNRLKWYTETQPRENFFNIAFFLKMTQFSIIAFFQVVYLFWLYSVWNTLLNIDDSCFSMILTDFGKEFDDCGDICYKPDEKKVFPGLGFCISLKSVVRGHVLR